jgi:tripeptide aminopeptidase
MSGFVEEATLSYIIRDHNPALFQQRLQLLEHITDYLNQLHPGSVRLEIRQQYKNMREIVESQMHIVELAYRAMEAVGVKPIVKPIRGGTDGSQLSYKGLPCPNLFAGGLNFHGRYEFVPVQSMEKAVEVIVKIVEMNLSPTG